jgi:hypothetical protein
MMGLLPPSPSQGFLRLLFIEEGSAPVRALHLNGTEDKTFPGITTKEDHHIYI